MSGLPGRRIGITGHQTLTPSTRRLVSAAIRNALRDKPEPTGIASLAAGADQLFAEIIVEVGGRLVVVLPAKHYEQSFQLPADLATFRLLLERADNIITMPFDDPSEEAYWAAGQEVVDQADWLLAVWDGQPAGGLGGTADVVRYAREQGKSVTVIWPEGARRS
jgi:putative heme iron utilization protein